jgi:hypothetical protein
MPKTTKRNLFYKKESCRTKKEKVCRDIVCYGITIFAAVMGFLLVNANANLANAESDFASTNVEMTQVLS